MDYKGFDIRVEVARNYIGPGYRATYLCSRGSAIVFAGTIVGNFPTIEEAEREAYKAAERRIDGSLA